MPLADTAIRKAKGEAKQYKLSDAGGLYLLIKPDGTKYWRLKYRLTGREKLLALGVYPQVSLADARTEREKAKGLMKQGLDPVTARKQDKRDKEIAGLTVERTLRGAAWCLALTLYPVAAPGYAGSFECRQDGQPPTHASDRSPHP